MASRVYVAGVGMIPFVKPGASEPYHVMGAEAARLRARATPASATTRSSRPIVGYVYGDSTCGQRALYQVGMTGIPIVNVNNNCSTGSTALFLARQAIASGAADCVLALGFEQMKPGALGSVFADRPSAFEDFDAAADRADRCARRSAGAALFRRRRPQPHEEARHAAVVLRQGARQGQPSRRRTIRWRCSARKSPPTT